MNLKGTLTLYADFGTGAVGIKKKHHGVISKPMGERGGHTQITHELAIRHVHQKTVGVKHPFHPKIQHHAPHASGGHMGKKKMFSEVDADASPSDLASHHLWQEPSSTDVTAQQWEAKRQMEKRMGRNMDPFESQAEMKMYGAAEVTGPCGCTLKIGEKVLVERWGAGEIKGRSNRILTIAIAGGNIQVDQKFVHRPQ